MQEEPKGWRCRGCGEGFEREYQREDHEAGCKTLAAQAPRFKVGDRVTALALPDGFPQARPEVRGLVVREVRRVETFTIRPYYRVTAYDRDGWPAVEGAEHFFELEAK